MIAVGSGEPVGATTEPTSVLSSETGMDTTFIARPMIALIRNVTPHATQNRPRVSRQDRTSASRNRACSSTRIDGTRRSLVDSQTTSGTLARAIRITTSTRRPMSSGVPPSPPATKAPMIRATTTRNPKIAMTESEANAARRQNAGAIRRQSIRSDAFTPMAA
ncbi:hypothetical protein SRABI76_02716 [Microbacterium oxydans]|nr:hypothetical protein SRABI76_02716 [Microbacterium oxydans]